MDDPHKLHKKLVSLLVEDLEVCEQVLPSKSDKEGIYQYLTSCSKNLKKYKAKHFNRYAVYGRYQDIYRTTFYAQDSEDSWKFHVKKHFGISEGYAKNLMSVGRLNTQNYKN